MLGSRNDFFVTLAIQMYLLILFYRLWTPLSCLHPRLCSVDELLRKMSFLLELLSSCWRLFFMCQHQEHLWIHQKGTFWVFWLSICSMQFFVFDRLRLVLLFVRLISDSLNRERCTLLPLINELSSMGNWCSLVDFSLRNTGVVSDVLFDISHEESWLLTD